MVDIVDAGLKMDNVDFTYNCQMGRGRTSSGMITACIAASIMHGVEDIQSEEEADLTASESDWSEERAYLNGMCFGRDYGICTRLTHRSLPLQANTR
jgi:hypothetical protein